MLCCPLLLSGHVRQSKFEEFIYSVFGFRLSLVNEYNAHGALNKACGALE